MITEGNSRADAAETARMVRDEVILRPARRAAAFCAIVILGLTAGNLAANAGEGPGGGLEVRPEIASAQAVEPVGR
jgi:hypothetical protein